MRFSFKIEKILHASNYFIQKIPLPDIAPNAFRKTATNQKRLLPYGRNFQKRVKIFTPQNFCMFMCLITSHMRYRRTKGVEITMLESWGQIHSDIHASEHQEVTNKQIVKQPSTWQRHWLSSPPHMVCRLEGSSIHCWFLARRPFL